MTNTVFISYSTADKFFAELLELKLDKAGVAVWRDKSKIPIGEEWRNSIDVGIEDCAAIVFAMSRQSCSSQYVTYEWASALGRGKPLIPVLLEDCDRHPKIEPIQHLDFRRHTETTWQQLVDRIQETIDDAEQADPISAPTKSGDPEKHPRHSLQNAKKAAVEIQAYLNEKGFRMVSFERIKKNIDKSYEPDFLNYVISNTNEFASALLKGKKPGLKLL